MLFRPFSFRVLKMPLPDISIKLKALFVHLCLSLALGLLAAILVFGFWFPYPYREIAGGWDLFVLVMLVDICCGPVLTFVVFSNKKPRKELVRDLGIIGVIQLAALFYGVYAVSVARPAHLVFEVDRFRVVSVADIELADLKYAPHDLQSLSLTGPTLIAARVPKSGDEDFVRVVELGMQGIEVSFQPKYWQSYEGKKDEVLKRAKSIADLKEKNPNEIERISSAVKDTGLAESKMGYLPLQGRVQSDWVAFIDLHSMEVVGFANVDGF